jgi:hypothetical protein
MESTFSNGDVVEKMSGMRAIMTLKELEIPERQETPNEHHW